MLKFVQWDIYTVLMVALVPAIVLAAWVLQSYDTDQLHRSQCELAESWLESSREYADQFEQAGTTGRTQLWINSVGELNSPNAASTLRSGILQSARYHAEHLPGLPTDEPGILNPKNGLFERPITEGAQILTEHCPETEDLIPSAFPMIFREDET